MLWQELGLLHLATGHQDADADDKGGATDDAEQALDDDDHDIVAAGEAGAQSESDGAVATEDAYEAASDEILGDGDASEYSMSRQGSLSGFSTIHTPTSCMSEVRMQ